MSNNFRPNPIVDYDIFIKHAINSILRDYGDKVSVDAKSKDLLKFGENTLVGTSRATVMNLPSGILHETMLSSNGVTHVVSSSGSDTQTLEFYEGQTISGGNFTFVNEDNSGSGITLTGQTPVELPTAMARTTRARLSSAAVGTIYFYEGGTIMSGVPDDSDQVHLIVPIGDTQSQKAATSISNSDYWVITQMTGSILKKTASFADFRIEIKEASDTRWYPISQKIAVSTSSGTIEIDFKPYLIVPKNHDVRLTVLADTSSVHCAGGVRGFLATVI